MRAVALLVFSLLNVSPLSAAAGAKAELLRRFECNRCHEGTGLPAAPHDKHCVRCHREILAGTFVAAPEHLARWRGHLRSLNAVPSLTAIGGRLRRTFVAGFLLQPHDLRPNLVAMMPRLALTATEADALAAELVPAENLVAPAPADAAAGRVLLESRGCGTCHRFSGVLALKSSPIPVAMTAQQQADALMLAPDLRHTGQAQAAGTEAKTSRVAWTSDFSALTSSLRASVLEMSTLFSQAVAIGRLWGKKRMNSNAARSNFISAPFR